MKAATRNRRGRRAQTGLLALAVMLAGCGGATGETVVIRSEGTGDVGIFIGEWAGTHHRQFQLGPGALARLRYLVVNAARSPEPPSWGSSTPAAVYYIFAQRRFLETAQGYGPRRLTGLLGVLNGLIDHND